MSNSLQDLNLPVLTAESIKDFLKSGELDGVSTSQDMANNQTINTQSLCSKLRAKMNKAQQDSPSIDLTNQALADKIGAIANCKTLVGTCNVTAKGVSTKRRSLDTFKHINDRKRKNTSYIKSRDSVCTDIPPNPPKLLNIQGKEKEVKQKRKVWTVAEKKCQNTEMENQNLEDQDPYGGSTSEDSESGIPYEGNVPHVGSTEGSFLHGDSSGGTSHVGSTENGSTHEGSVLHGGSTEDAVTHRGTTEDNVPQEDDTEGVVEVPAKTEGGLQVYKNSVGVEFTIDLTDEVRFIDCRKS